MRQNGCSANKFEISAKLKYPSCNNSLPILTFLIETFLRSCLRNSHHQPSPSRCTSICIEEKTYRFPTLSHPFRVCVCVCVWVWLSTQHFVGRFSNENSSDPIVSNIKLIKCEYGEHVGITKGSFESRKLPKSTFDEPN